MSAKPMILRELEKLPPNDLKEVERFVGQLKKSQGKRQTLARNGKVLARTQRAAIKKWAGRDLGRGFNSRDHDRILYGDNG
jgi:mRNA-degrading endonuclease RelE of RelBE toxin-antitoxin system